MYDLTIPGWANEEQLMEIERLAKLVPKYGKRVEEFADKYCFYRA